MKAIVLLTLFLPLTCVSADRLLINDQGYFEKPGLNVTVFSDIYPDGHQTGVSVIQQGVRVAANGDLRLEASPGQWSPVPKGGELKLDKNTRTITQTLSYPDPDKNRTGFNPINYPDLEFSYSVHVQALKGNSFRVSVDLDEALPKEWIGKVGFNFELFPGHLFGKSWLMLDENENETGGIFPVQANGPIEDVHGEWLNTPLATGKKLIVAPAQDMQRLSIETSSGELQLLDGRSNHNNGWYIVRSLVPAGAVKGVVEWTITPNTVEGWQRKPIIQVSQLGYAADQPKRIIIEQDKHDEIAGELHLFRLGANGRTKVLSKAVEPWGKFLRYRYFSWDFSDIETPGMYIAEYRGEVSHAFKIGNDVFARHAWQPTLEYYLPVQMCHMRVNEKYRVWHGLCHDDDALMSPVNTNHFDGYISGPETLTAFKPLEPVPGLNKGGWHDAGDYDLRVESQMTTVWLLSLMVEEFGLNYDATTIDQENKLVEIHQPDGRNDALQQVEHGLLSVLGAYRALGRLYRGIITPTIRQYVLLGDGSTQSDNKVYDKDDETSIADDRQVFTEKNPSRELNAAAGLAAASRVLQDYNPGLASDALNAAQELYRLAHEAESASVEAKAFASAELLLTTDDLVYKKALLELEKDLVANIGKTAWAIGRAVPQVENKQFTKVIASAVEEHQKTVVEAGSKTPYGVPYEPHIWGAGWGIQRFGVNQYLVHKAWPEHASFVPVLDALNFVLGVHPGENTMSFASGVGANSALVAYGVNRADWSFIPGGVISGTALIRPDLPELKTWPFFWQQTEYVMGGGATNYMFLVLAANAAYTSQ
jgi:hypothetical protein